jgi:hypothetical protein
MRFGQALLLRVSCVVVLLGGGVSMASLDHSNPIDSHLSASKGTRAEHAAVQAEFLAGNWAVFRTFAALAVEVRLPPLPAAPKNPHARFWSSVLTEATPKQKAELLRYLLTLQLGSPWDGERAALLLPPPSKEVQAQLLRYFAGFQQPSRTEALETLVGPRLQRYPNLPHERLVALARFLPTGEVLPHLTRFLAARRRYYQLFTDYSTRPEEVDGVVRESLGALLALADREKGDTEKIRQALVGLANPAEELEFERYSDRGSRGEPVQTVRILQMEPPARDSFVPMMQVEDTSELVSRKQWIAWALEALDGKREALARFAPRTANFAQNEWSVLAGDGLYLSAPGHAYALTEGFLWAFDPRTGRTRFHVPLQRSPASGDLRFDSRSGAVTPDGHVALVGELHEGAGKTWHVFLFDRETGEVVKDIPVAENKPSSLVRATRDAVTLTSGKDTWVQASSGKLLARLTSESAPVFAVDEHTVALAAGNQLSLLSPELKPLTGWPVRVPPEASKGLAIESLLLTEQTVFALTASTVLCWHRSGEFLGARKLESITWGIPPFWDGTRAWVAGGQTLQGFTADDQPATVIELPREVKAMGPLGERILVVRDGGVGTVSAKDTSVQPWSDDITAHMSSIVRVGPKDSLLLTYRESRYFLIRPRATKVGAP